MTTTDQYRVVFDASRKAFQWWFPALGLIFVCIGGVMIWWGRRNQWSLWRMSNGYFMAGFACLWSALTLGMLLPEYLSLQSGVRQGQFSVVEGAVTDFRPMPHEGHKSECFSVREQTFCYSDYEVTAGFNNSTSHGGPIREGLPVRVSYIGGTIVRLEVRADALPSAQQRAAVTEDAKTDWQHRTQDDPQLDRMTLGFGIAAFFMTAWWNLQPKRFMKFWIKPPYKPFTVVLFKLFFAANVIGAAWYMFDLLRRRHRELSEYRDVAVIAAVCIAVIFVMVTTAEWVNRRRLNTGA
jgi:hypothetical protein